jgi:hypothetical protein
VKALLALVLVLSVGLYAGGHVVGVADAQAAGAPGRPASSSAPTTAVVTDHYQDSLRGTLDGMGFLLLRGTGPERGLAHGALAAKEIVAVIDDVAGAVTRSGGSWSQVLLATAGFSFPSEYEAQLSAMLDGIRVSLPNPADRQVAALGREIRLEDLKALHALADTRCSQFSSWGGSTVDGEVIVGRNLDYMPLIAAERYALIAQVPEETGLLATLDVATFGSVGAGGVSLNAEGVYAAVNNGGSPELRSGANPEPLIIRTALEGAHAGAALDHFIAVLGSSPATFPRIVHVAFPAMGASGPLPSAVEWDPTDGGFGVRLRPPDSQDLPDALVITNHFGVDGSGDSQVRYNQLRAAILDYQNRGQPIGLEQAKSMLDSVSRSSSSSTTLISAVIWPKLRRVVVAISPQAGVSATRGRWITVDWQDLFGAQPEGQTFADVSADHPYFRQIEALYHAGFTAGCATNPLRYCPEQTMNRAESAVFVERGIHSSEYVPPQSSVQVFADVALDSWSSQWVNGLWEDRYTAGCGTDPLIYCPWQGHTRAEGCVFYLRMMNGETYEPAQPTAQTFGDVPLDVWYAKWVKVAYDAGLLTACQTSPELRFCPNDPLTRAQAAYMMVQAKGLH